MQHQLFQIKNGFYSLCIVLVGVCFYLANNTVDTFRLLLLQKVYSPEALIANADVKTIVTLSQKNLDLINAINFYSFILLCLVAAFLDFKLNERKHYFIALATHTFCLCVCYFWLGDMLYVLKKQYQLLTHIQNANFMIFATKFLFASIFASVFVLLVRSLKKTQTSS